MKLHPPEPHLVRVVLLFDNNMPAVMDCHYGCSSNSTYMCYHRFGPRIWVTKLRGIARQPDLEVSGTYIRHIRTYWGNRRGVDPRKHYVLVTKDRKFLDDVQRQFGAREELDGYPLLFEPPKAGTDGVIQSGRGRRRVRLEVHVVPGGFDRANDLRHVRLHAHTLW